MRSRYIIIIISTPYCPYTNYNHITRNPTLGHIYPSIRLLSVTSIKIKNLEFKSLKMSHCRTLPSITPPHPTIVVLYIRFSCYNRYDVYVSVVLIYNVECSILIKRKTSIRPIKCYFPVNLIRRFRQ